MGNGKRRKWETEMKTKLHALIAFSNTSATGDSEEELSRDYIAYASVLHTKSIIDRPECCGCVTSHRTGQGRTCLWARQASRAAILGRIFKTSAPCS